MCQIKVGGGCLCKDGRNCLKYLERGWNRKEGRGRKDLKRGQAQSGGGCLKKGGWSSLTSCVLAGS